MKQYHPVPGGNGTVARSVHLQRQGENKVLLVRRKLMGEGLHAEEFDL